MYRKKILLNIVCTIIFCTTPNINADNITPQNNTSRDITEDDEQFFTDILDDDDPFLDDFLSTPAAPFTTRQLDPEIIIKLLLEVDALRILQEDLFLHTYPLNKQSLLDMPILGDTQCVSFDKNVSGIDLFWNQTSRSNFTPGKTNLGSYLALQRDSLIDKLQNSLDELKELLGNPIFNLDIRKIFDLFQNMTVQERRIGGMFFWMRQWKRFVFHVKVPLYYLERNFSLTNEEQKAVEEEFGASDPEDQEKLQEEHFISDKFGVGDTRLEVKTLVYESPDFNVYAGTQTTIPTAFPIVKGIIGSTFERPPTFPLFDFDELFDLGCQIVEEDDPEIFQALQEKAFRIVNSFSLGALDRLAANLLDAKLGNDGHLGIGFFVQTKSLLSLLIKRRGASNIHLSSKISVEYLFPAHEDRFYIEKDNRQEYKSRDFTDPTKAMENLAFLEQELINKAYLLAFATRVQPGLIFRWSSKMCFQGRRWGWTLGSDTWLQGKDRLQTIKIPSHCKPTTTLDRIDEAKAKPILAYRGRLLGGVTYKTKQKNPWFISLNVDGTLLSGSGIGKDFTAFFKFEKRF